MAPYKYGCSVCTLMRRLQRSCGLKKDEKVSVSDVVFIARSVISQQMTMLWTHRGPIAAIAYYILFGTVKDKGLHLSIAS